MGSSTSNISRSNRRSCAFSPYKLGDMSTEHVKWCHRSPASSTLHIGLPIAFELPSVASCYVGYVCAVVLVLTVSDVSFVVLYFWFPLAAEEVWAEVWLPPVCLSSSTVVSGALPNTNGGKTDFSAVTGVTFTSLRVHTAVASQITLSCLGFLDIVVIKYYDVSEERIVSFFMVT